MNRPIHGGNLAWAADLAGCSPHSILDFSASINPLGPPQTAISAVQAHLDTLTTYPDPSCKAICQTLSRIHQLPMNWFLPGNGSAELLTWACRDLAQLPATAMVTPAFADYRRALNAFQAQIRSFSLDFKAGQNDSLPGLMDQVLTSIGQSTEISESGLLLNNPHNPTGQILSLNQTERLLNQFAWVVVDEAFMDFVPSQDQFSLIPKIQDFPNLIILRSLTKFYSLPGLRLGYAVGHPDHLQRWQQWRDPWSVNSLAMAAGVAVLEDHAFQTQTMHWLPHARSQLMTGLIERGFRPYQSAANFLLVATDVSVPSLQEVLLKHHQILIRDCLSFPELGEHFFRVAVRTPEENQRLLNALAHCMPSISV
ncbi:threonine-phosphate decarboxylase CobD [Acaryochloris sp. IP29b_bin.137]|uniref:threonine-phosphate decarboxylase CobD n=1 Tax=Acaryochloris sp. IP29b_bin.137 TaxID=2969217 RepID=UPI002620EEC9|nr:threonine-phosphate decarboxylase CobD [Acaryochloris sp. IP29b_bin.137]